MLIHLLEHPRFLNLLTGMTIGAYEVCPEPVSKKFDIGLRKDQHLKWELLIELKMWSSLSENQLKDQSQYLQKENIPGLHILLGTADIVHFTDAQYDQILISSNQSSRKVGYLQLIDTLEKFTNQSEPSILVDLAKHYQLAYYSLYHHIRQHLPGSKYPIKSVNNAAGGAIIMGDDASWISFSYENIQFQAYQEILNGTYMIRIWSKSAKIWQRHQVRSKFIATFAQADDTGINWKTNHKASIWHKILTHEPEFKSEEQFKSMAELMQKLQPLIKTTVEKAFPTRPVDFL